MRQIKVIKGTCDGGRMVISISSTLKRELKVLAKASGISMSTLMRTGAALLVGEINGGQAEFAREQGKPIKAEGGEISG